MNVATNLGAMAIMAFVPGSAVVVAPLLIAYNSAPIVDHMESESERGTLTLGEAATSVGEIALNLLPLAGRAKPFTAGWFAIEGANWGGQAILMTASAIQTARQLQSQDVEVLAGMYEELQKLEASGADPAAIESKRAQVMARAKAVSDRIEQALKEQVAQNAMFAVAGSIIHRAASVNAQANLIESYLKARGEGDGAAPATGAEAGGAGAEQHPAGTEPADPGAAAGPQADRAPDKEATPASAPRGGDRHARPATSQAVDGQKIAAQVPGATYEPGGTFRIKSAEGDVEVAIRRTNGTARLVRVGDHIEMEIPRGLTGRDLERAVVDQLREARDEVVHDATSPEITRRPHPGDDHEYQYDAMHPGPLSDESTYGDPRRTGSPLPAQGFFGGKYDVQVLKQETVFYRVGDGERAWGQWWTDHPLESEAQYRIDVAVKPVWTNPATGEVPAGSARSEKQLELWSYEAKFPKGTTVYSGPVGTQGGVNMGGSSTKQYFIPQAWKLESKGAAIVAKQPLDRGGGLRPAPDPASKSPEGSDE